MEALIGLMLLLAFLGTLDFGAMFRHKKPATPVAKMESERETVGIFR
jgi:hypothetical protein